MINIRPLIEQRIRSQVPDFLAVAGAASLKAVLSSLLSNLGCYVVPERRRANASETRNTLVTQKLELHTAVIIVVNNVRDARGVDAADISHALQTSVMNALLGQRIGAGTTPIEYVDGGVVSFVGGFYIWKDSYKTNTIIKALS